MALKFRHLGVHHVKDGALGFLNAKVACRMIGATVRWKGLCLVFSSLKPLRPCLLQRTPILQF